MNFLLKVRKDVRTFNLNGSNKIYAWEDKRKLCFRYGPAVIGADGYQAYYLNDKLHREDGPAVIWSSGIQEYWLNGIRHRKDGPAVIWPSGIQEYWLNGIRQGDIFVLLRSMIFILGIIKDLTIFCIC